VTLFSCSYLIFVCFISFFLHSSYCRYVTVFNVGPQLASRPLRWPPDHSVGLTGSPAHDSEPLQPILPSTGSGEWSTCRSRRARASVAEHPLAVQTTYRRCPYPHTTDRARRGRENRASTHNTRQQRWPKPCLCDGKSELSLLSCHTCLFIQL